MSSESERTFDLSLLSYVARGQGGDRISHHFSKAKEAMESATISGGLLGAHTLALSLWLSSSAQAVTTLLTTQDFAISSD